MIFPPDVVDSRDLFMLAAVAVEQQPLLTKEVVLEEDSDVEDITDQVKGRKCGSRKRALSVDCEAENSLKRAKDEAGKVVATYSVSKIERKFSKENAKVADASGSAIAPMPRRIYPFPKPAQGIQKSIKSIPDVDISWIPKSYRKRSSTSPDTPMHKLFLSECNYLLPEYHENGAVRRRNQNEREEFLNADEWAEVRGGYEVRCKACKRDISLDPREGMYYANLWIKHRSSCPGVYSSWLERNGWSRDSDKDWFRNKRIMH
ncbi:uncharacterized protein BT62DRAFT_1014298 [Guyanagaster necrorhizus]|uniref:Uncharacterized protein n=1 Tax=Guyanagaster necrorhizus TaxID=856835 RepID=A0A9P7VFE9_9AGAR|nr:uncharacterized protein BT62DRAFT_1014298 [Guyanagaster necrorhizus MCA 3950]KAG7439166.1 hypothetical protein BT62DRAFT_1014298 [Guyanagaster necrorhizus MCA 3950]